MPIFSLCRQAKFKGGKEIHAIRMGEGRGEKRERKRFQMIGVGLKRNASVSRSVDQVIRRAGNQALECLWTKLITS